MKKMDIFRNIEKIKELEADIKSLKSSLEYARENRKESDKNHELTILELKSEYSIESRERDSHHALEMRDEEFKRNHFKDDELKRVTEENIKIAKDFAVLEMETKLLKEVTDVNSDIIDVKELVTKLIEKMPNLDLKNLIVNATPTNNFKKE